MIIGCHQTCRNKEISTTIQISTDTMVANRLFHEAVKSVELAEYKRAISLADSARSIFEASSIKHPALLKVYDVLGEAYYGYGDNGKARANFLEAYAIFLNSENQDSIKLASIYKKIGNSFYREENDDSAMIFYKISKQLLIQTPANVESELATIEDNIGAIYAQNLEKLDSAKSYFKRAIKLRRNLSKIDSIKLALSYVGLSYVYSYEDSINIALKIANQSCEIRKKILGETHPITAKSYSMISRIYNKMGIYDKADSLFSLTLKIYGYTGSESLKNISDVALIPYVLGEQLQNYQEWYIKTSNPLYLKKVDELYPAVTDAIEYRLKNMSPNSKTTVSSQAFEIYSKLISSNYRLYIFANNPSFLERNFILAEKSKSLMLLEAVKNSGALLFSGIPESLIQLENRLQTEISDYEKIVNDKFINGLMVDSESVLSTLKHLSKTTQRHKALLNKIEKEYPKYYEATKRLKYISLPALQKNLRPNQALLEYFITDDNIYLFAIRPDSFKVVTVPNDFSLKDRVTEMRAGILKTTDGTVSPQYVDAARLLYEKLFAPVQGFFKEGTQLTIVPDGELGYVPFDALLYENPKELQVFPSYGFLMKKYPISYCYSATLLRDMQEKQHGTQPSRNFLGVAPSFSGNPSRPASYGKDILVPLKSNDDEVKEIEKQIGGNVQIGSKATEQSFTQAASDYRILHLSTHGKANDQVGDYSYLAFAEIPDSIENERLFNRELYNLRLNADMVVLSACETGIGELQRGEGIISLARGFSYAGAKSIVTTLWEIREEPSKQLLYDFYENLQNGMSKDSALWQAKLKSLEGPAPEPFYWAAFIPIGDMQAIPLEGSNHSWWAWVLVAATGALVFVWWRRRKIT
jgi:CHAT domain-containing protein